MPKRQREPSDGIDVRLLAALLPFGTAAPRKAPLPFEHESVAPGLAVLLQSPWLAPTLLDFAADVDGYLWQDMWAREALRREALPLDLVIRQRALTSSGSLEETLFDLRLLPRGHFLVAPVAAGKTNAYVTYVRQCLALRPGAVAVCLLPPGHWPHLCETWARLGGEPAELHLTGRRAPPPQARLLGATRFPAKLSREVAVVVLDEAQRPGHLQRLLGQLATEHLNTRVVLVSATASTLDIEIARARAREPGACLALFGPCRPTLALEVPEAPHRISNFYVEELLVVAPFAVHVGTPLVGTGPRRRRLFEGTVASWEHAALHRCPASIPQLLRNHERRLAELQLLEHAAKTPTWRSSTDATARLRLLQEYLGTEELDLLQMASKKSWATRPYPLKDSIAQQALSCPFEHWFQTLRRYPRDQIAHLGQLLTDTAPDCAVCMSTMTRPVAAWPCLHAFCSACLGSWLRGPHVKPCPLCKQEVRWQLPVVEVSDEAPRDTKHRFLATRLLEQRSGENAPLVVVGVHGPMGPQSVAKALGNEGLQAGVWPLDTSRCREWDAVCARWASTPGGVLVIPLEFDLYGLNLQKAREFVFLSYPTSDDLTRGLGYVVRPCEPRDLRVVTLAYSVEHREP